MERYKDVLSKMKQFINGKMFCNKTVYTVVATSTCTSVKPAISPSNVAQNANSGTVLDSARPEDSKTPPTC